MSERDALAGSVGPATAREAAIRILLGDIAPLFQRVSELQQQFAQLQDIQQTIQTELHGDMQQLGGTVAGVAQEARRLQNAGAEMGTTLQRLEHLVARLETALLPCTSQSGKSAVTMTGAPVWLVVLLALLLCTALAGAGLLFWQQQQSRNALAAGHATLKAWPQLSDSARRAIEAASRR